VAFVAGRDHLALVPPLQLSEAHLGNRDTSLVVKVRSLGVTSGRVFFVLNIRHRSRLEVWGPLRNCTRPEARESAFFACERLSPQRWGNSG
jgi:hypothetical protein